MFDGPRDILSFKKNGNEFFKYYIELCNLKPEEKILDIGCGIGRKTIPLIKYMNESGKYVGFDIIKAGIDWCINKISKKYPNFQFQLVDVYNKYYNPKGKYKPSEFRFPLNADSFDFVAAGSVFTHMLPEDVENYISEIARVLKKGGRSLITYFLLTNESRELITEKKSDLDFKYDMVKYMTTNPDIPENAVCYSEKYIIDTYEKNGMKIINPIYYGSWCGRQNYLSYQDIIIAVKT